MLSLQRYTYQQSYQQKFYPHPCIYICLSGGEVTLNKLMPQGKKLNPQKYFIE